MVQFDFRKYWLILVSLVLFSFNVFAQSGAWTKKADIPKGGGSASVVDGKISVLGGTTAGSFNDLNYNEMYNPATNIWEEKTPMPTARGFLTTAVVNETIYAIGGGYPNSSKKLEAYNPVTDTWVTKADMLNYRLGMQAAVVDGIIYIFGGNYTSRNCEAYDPSTNTWTSKADLPEGGGVVSVTAFNGLVYVFGGGYSSSFSTVYAYNPQTNSWTKKKDMPTPRFFLQTFLVNEKIYAMGGVKSEGGVSLATVEVYDPVNDTWETMGNMPSINAGFAGAVVNEKIYVIGGTPNWGTTMSRTVWEYDPSFSVPVAAGNVSGTWTLANSPYHINGEIIVPNDSTLTIEPGVEVVFMGHYKLNVQGRLLAVGTQKDSIRFTAEDKETGWHGVRFINTPNTNNISKLEYCSFKYGKANTGVVNSLDRCGGAIMINECDSVLVSHCLFESNMTSGDLGSTGGPGVCIFNGSPTITDNTFINNDGTGGSAGAIKVDFTSNAVISNNIISNNKSAIGAVICGYLSSNQPTISGNIISNNTATTGGGGIFIWGNVKPKIENNIITHNQAPTGGGAYCGDNANPILINNTIVDNSASNGGGVYFESNSDGIFINNILFGNTATSSGNQVFLNDAASDPVFKYCDVQGGKEGFAGTGAGANYSGLYENNIDVDPSFANASADDYSLSNVSQCIGAGTESIEIDGTMYHCPSLCINGVARPSPAGSNPDIGACENLLGTFVDVEEELTAPKEFTLYQNYPNPFNPTTTIKYSIPQTVGNENFRSVQLIVYDILGNEIATLVNEEKPAGGYEVTWNAGNLPSGVYFYQLKAGSYTATKKLLLLK